MSDDKQPPWLNWALEDNYCPGRGQVAENLLKKYRARLATEGMEMSGKERFDFVQGAYIGLMVMEGMLRGTDSEALKRLIQQVSEK
jgi:hypothetical protein